MAAAAVRRGTSAALRVRATYATSATAEQVIQSDKSNVLNLYARNPIVFERGEGCYLYDVDGKRYLDFYAGIATTSLGHGDKEWVTAIADQASRLGMVANLFYNRPAVELAEKLKAKSFADKVFFCNSGAEAAEGAIKIARKYGLSRDASGKKHHVVAFHGGFHGRTMGSLSATANEAYRKPFLPLVPGFHHVPLNDLDALRAAITDETCAVIIEPIQGEGGVNSASNEFLREIRALCDKHDALMVVDEVQCGLGRTGRLWAHEEALVVPDLMTLAKALGNGVPIGAVLVNKRAAAPMAFGDHGTTFGGQPIACRAGCVVFDRVSQPAFLQHVDSMGRLLRQELLALNSPLITEVRGRGLIAGVAIDRTRAKLADVSPILRACHQRGLVLINAGAGVLRMLPPLVVQENHVREAVAILGEVLHDVSKAV